MSLAADFEKARQLQAQGYSASYIAGKTGLNAEQARNVVARQTAPAAPTPSPAPTPSAAPARSSSGGGSPDGGSSGGGGGFSPPSAVNPLDAQMALLGAELQNRSSVSNYGWDAQKVMENVRQAGATERQKLVNENNLAVTDKEVKGKLDLQAIVNSGYKNIANIERGSDMFRSIMSAFNF